MAGSNGHYRADFYADPSW
jgi:hypothetical protein